MALQDTAQNIAKIDWIFPAQGTYSRHNPLRTNTVGTHLLPRAHCETNILAVAPGLIQRDWERTHDITLLTSYDILGTSFRSYLDSAWSTCNWPEDPIGMPKGFQNYPAEPIRSTCNWPEDSREMPNGFKMLSVCLRNEC